MKITNFLIITLTIIAVCLWFIVAFLCTGRSVEIDPVGCECVVDEIERMQPAEPALANDIPMESIEEPIVEETTEVDVVNVRTDVTYYDVPLEDDLQAYIYDLCKEYKVDMPIVLTMIFCESTYRSDVVGDRGNSYGLMQIQPRWHAARMEKLGVGSVEELLDPRKNVLVGIDFLAELVKLYGNIDTAMAVYNGGPRASRDLDNHYVKKIRKNLEGVEVRA